MVCPPPQYGGSGRLGDHTIPTGPAITPGERDPGSRGAFVSALYMIWSRRGASIYREDPVADR